MDVIREGIAKLEKLKKEEEDSSKKYADEDFDFKDSSGFAWLSAIFLKLSFALIFCRHLYLLKLNGVFERN